MKTHLSLHQRIHNADGSQQIENLKAIHAYTHARNWPVEEWDNQKVYFYLEETVYFTENGSLHYLDDDWHKLILIG